MIDIKIDEKKLRLYFTHPQNTSFLFLVKREENYFCVSFDEIKQEEILCSISIHNTYYLVNTNINHFNNLYFRVFIKKIVELAPFFAEYEIIVENKNMGTVEEYLENKVTKLEDLQFLYHGTSTYYVDSILKEGLKPRIETNVLASFSGKKEEGSPNCVYLCTHARYDLKRSGGSAIQKAGGKNTILKIDMAGIDKNKLKSCDKFGNDYLSINESLAVSKNLRYYGIIEPQFITNEGFNPYVHANVKAIQYYISKENNDSNRANTDASMQGK